MKAVVKVARGVGNIQFRDLPEPTPGSDEIKVKVAATGICGTDLHILHDSFRYNPPIVIGHEFGGVVTEVGDKVTRFKVGDKVTAEAPARICGTCKYCSEGNYNLCSNRLGLGWGIDGSFATYCVIEEKMAHHIPGNVTLREAALCEPLACVTHGVLELTSILPDDVVVVSGPGPIGLLTMQVAKAQRAKVIVCGVSADRERLQLAVNLGADKVIDVQQESLSDFVRGITDGYGCDVVFECSGAQASVSQCLDVVRKGGQYTQVGLFGRPIQVDFEKIALKEIKVTGVQSQKRTSWEKALDLVSRKDVNLDALISDEFKLSDWDKAFQLIESKKALKVLLYPEG